MESDWLIFAMLSHVSFTVLLYALLTLVRAPAVWGVWATRDGRNPWEALEPRVSANLSNQFEWPMFFYVVCVLLLTGAGKVDIVQAALAWIFVVGRIIHSAVQILTTNIRLRGMVFTINFIAVLAMWIWLVGGRFLAS